ncbi:MAG: hypothetical protein ACI9VS_001043 [Candidatus Binatia bacterium]|jgi:hypothetical protein
MSSSPGEFTEKIRKIGVFRQSATTAKISDVLLKITYGLLAVFLFDLTEYGEIQLTGDSLLIAKFFVGFLLVYWTIQYSVSLSADALEFISIRNDYFLKKQKLMDESANATGAGFTRHEIRLEQERVNATIAAADDFEELLKSRYWLLTRFTWFNVGIVGVAICLDVWLLWEI